MPGEEVTGGQDVQVPPQDVAETGCLTQGPLEGHVMGNLSHLFRPHPVSAGPRAYRRAVREPVDAEVLKLITSWSKPLGSARQHKALSRLRTQTMCSGQRHKDRAGRVRAPSGRTLFSVLTGCGLRSAGDFVLAAFATAGPSCSRALVLDRRQTMDGVMSTHTVLVFDEL